MNDNASKLKELIRRKELIESEVRNLLDELEKKNTNMNDPLVDNDGYPRSDVDVYSIRFLRQQIICKQNDCKAIFKEIESGIHALHSEEKVKPNIEFKLKKKESVAFAEVDTVEKNSPAYLAELKPHDLIVRFGSVTNDNFRDLSSISRVVSFSIQKPIHVIVMRNDDLKLVVLTPKKWNGKGLLGCTIVPLKR